MPHAPDDYDQLNWDIDRRLDKRDEQHERPHRVARLAPLHERIAVARAESELCPSCGSDGSCDPEHCERAASRSA